MIAGMNEVRNEEEGANERMQEENWFEGFEGGMIDQVRAGMNEVEHVGERVAERELGGANEGVAVEGRGGRVFRGRRSRCRLCGATLSYANMARHERTHRVWDPGGGPNPE